MREYLYRGKTAKGKWVYGAYYKQEHFYGDEEEVHCIIITKDVLSNDLGLEYEEVIPESIGQFIGLTDKNGRKIFEGDIIQFGEDEDYDWDFNIGVVKFGEGTFDSGIYRYTGFFYKDKKGNIDHNALYNWEEDWEKCKVIGNIYDNPNLLNKELEE